MTIHLKEIRKVAVLGWETEGDDAIKGSTASLQVEDEEKRTVKNDRESNLFFPLNFSGAVKVTIEGSKSGTSSETIQIP